MNAKVILLIAVLTLFLLITLQNTETAEFRMLFWPVSMSRIVIMYICVLIGFIAGFIFAKVSAKKKEREIETVVPPDHRESDITM